MAQQRAAAVALIGGQAQIKPANAVRVKRGVRTKPTRRRGSAGTSCGWEHNSIRLGKDWKIQYILNLAPPTITVKDHLDD